MDALAEWDGLVQSGAKTGARVYAMPKRVQGCL